MKTLMLMAVGLSLAGGSIAQAQPYGPDRGPPPGVAIRDGDRDGRHDDGRDDGWRRHHHSRRVCEWRHHERVCHWRH